MPAIERARERRKLHVWGSWDDTPRYADAVKYPTREEAIEALRGYDEQGTVFRPLDGDEPVTMRMYDCEFDGPKPCDDPNCRHGHDALVWQFDAYIPEVATELGMMEVVDDV